MTNNFERLKNLEKKILCKEITDFSEQFDEIQKDLKLNSELRYFGHLKGKVKYTLGHYDDAFKIFQSTLDEFGPHIGLLCDYSFSLMLKGDYIKAKEVNATIRAEYTSAKDFISENSRIRTLIFLAKTCMEWCLFSESISYYKEAIALEGPGSLWNCLARIGLLRVKSFLKMYDNEWRSLYIDVSQMPIGNYHYNYERIHALFLAESHLYNLNELAIRTETLIESSIGQKNPGLIGALLTEHTLLSKTGNIDHPAIIKFKNTKPTDGFEKVLQVLLISSESTLTSTDLQNCLELISKENPLGQHRIYSLLLEKIESQPQKKELQRYWATALQALSKENRKLAQNTWPVCEEKDLQRVLIKLDGRNFYFNNREIKLPPHTLTESLISELTSPEHKPNLETDYLIQITWNEKLNKNSLDRLKVTLSRINGCFQLICGVKLFIFTKQKIEINKSVEILVTPH